MRMRTKLRTGNASRRDVLYGFAAGGACLLTGAGASAITPLPQSDYGAVLDTACGLSADHRRQIAAVESALGVSLPDARVTEALRRTVCPSCGCPLVAPVAAPGSF